MSFGYHASHEQVAPLALLRHVQAATEAGFSHAMCSDHFSPWSAAEGGQSGFAWSWLGAALATTQHTTFGVVTAPGQRYHPAILAQAIATLAQMFEGRFWVALASGELLNEHVVDPTWPAKSERQARLLECVQVIRSLLAGELVTHRGRVLVDRARLYTLPKTAPPLLGAAVSEESAAWVASWADGLVTVNQPPDTLRRVLAAFRDAGGAGKPAYLQVHLSLAASDEAALASAHSEWRQAALGGPLSWDAATPEDFDAACRFIRPEDLRESIRISADVERQIEWLQEDFAMGFDRVYLHQVGKDQTPLFEAAPVLQRRLPGGR